MNYSILRLLLFCFPILLSGADAETVHSDNLLKNPSFEISEDGVVPTGWRFWLDRGTQGTLTADTAHTGSLAVKLTAPGKAVARLCFKSGGVPVDEQTTYRLSAWIKGEGIAWRLSYFAYKSSKGQPSEPLSGDKSDMLQVGPEWKEYTLDIKTPSNTTNIDIFVEGNSGKTEPATIYIDDLVLAPAQN